MSLGFIPFSKLFWTVLFVTLKNNVSFLFLIVHLLSSPIVYLYYCYYILLIYMWDFNFIMYVFAYDTRNIYSLCLFLSRTLTTKIFLSSRALNNNSVGNLYGRHVGLTLDIESLPARRKCCHSTKCLIVYQFVL
jgi:hypothetical protein